MKTLLLCALILSPLPVLADAPAIEAVQAQHNNGKWSYSVTLSHPDTGWDHYADGWEVLSPDGQRLGFRELLHPHVTEQPFTRSLSGVVVPVNIDHVMIRAKCSVDGWTSQPFRVDLNR